MYINSNFTISSKLNNLSGLIWIGIGLLVFSNADPYLYMYMAINGTY
jgi:hypothetical protein